MAEQHRLSIGELAKRASVSTGTIRYYERIGLMPKPPRTSAGYRQYCESATGRVRLIQNALQFGFSLKELCRFLGIRESGGAPCKQVRAAAGEILQAVDGRIAELTASREAIRETLIRWDEKLLQTPEGRPAYLLEALPERGRPRGLRGTPTSGP